MNSNLHIYILAAPLLTSFFLGIFGRKKQALIAPLVLGSLALSSAISVVVLNRTLEIGPLSYTVGAWLPPWGIELLVDPLSGLMLLLIAVVALVASFAAIPWVQK
ncbi:MAG: hypothetical protein GWN87_00720, partial [Desulfuromonadales bacterium]|nr:hypothetical protein [Desulfuromonadales bacterium]NIS39280.1 hypothetical protein [Desulfuromonadales bacterium]